MTAPLNLLAAEAPIIARLRAEIADASVQVGSAANVAGRMDITRYCPGVFVQPGPSQPAGDETDAVEAETWDVVVVTKLLQDKADLTADFSEAGLLMGAAFRALTGWQPTPEFQPIVYRGRGDVVVGQGFVQFPMSFELTALKG